MMDFIGLMVRYGVESVDKVQKVFLMVVNCYNMQDQKDTNQEKKHMKLIVGTKAFPITRARAVRSSVPVLKDDKRKIAFLELELLSLLELFLLLCCDCYPSVF